MKENNNLAAVGLPCLGPSEVLHSRLLLPWSLGGHHPYSLTGIGHTDRLSDVSGQDVITSRLFCQLTALSTSWTTTALVWRS